MTRIRDRGFSGPGNSSGEEDGQTISILTKRYEQSSKIYLLLKCSSHVSIVNVASALSVLASLEKRQGAQICIN